jgi:putative SOS response-associated peptidase YedK
MVVENRLKTPSKVDETIISSGARTAPRTQNTLTICHNLLVCGRYRLSRRKQIIEEYFGTVSGEDDWNPRYNIAPTQPVPVIRQNPKEPVRELSLIRCLIPADGFYEWQRRGKVKQPFCFEVNDGELFAFAGLWDRWRDPSGQWLKSFSILTTTPNAVTSFVHDRMPVVLDPDSYDLWLDPGMTKCRGGIGNVEAFRCPTDEVLSGKHSYQLCRQ